MSLKDPYTAAPKPPPRFSSGCMVLFGLPFAAVGIFMGFLAINSVLQWNEMRSWQEVPATILESRLETSSGSDSTTYRVEALYEYAFGGRTYRGDRVGIHGGNDNIGSFHEEAARELSSYRQTGEPFRCFVDPENPQRSVLYRELRMGLMAFYGLFVVLFGGAGVVVIGFAILGRKKLSSEAKRAEVSPDEPWRWKTEWAQGRIVSGSRSTMFFSLGFAVFWNLISLPLLFVLPNEILEEKNYPALLGLLFPIVGVGLLVWALRATLQWRRFGRSVFEMAKVPGVIGGPLQGVIRIPNRLPRPEEGFEISLSSVHRRTRGSGKNRSTTETVLWQDQRVLERPLRADAVAGTILPVVFAIPFDAKESANEPSDSKIIWKLRARADIPGVDLDQTFEVPVFRTDESAPDFVLEEGRLRDFERPSGVEEAFRRRRAVVRDLGEDGRSYFFPSGANAAQKAVVLFLLAGLSITLGLMLRQGAGCLPLAIAGFFELVFAASALSLWLARYQVDIRPGLVTLQGGAFGPGSPQTFTASQVASWEIKAGSQTGTNVSHDLVLVLHDGKRKTCARGLGSRRQAELILEDMKSFFSPETPPQSFG